MQDAIGEHVREAWPVLIPREPDETRSSWRERVASAHSEAIEVRDRLWHEHRMGDPVLPGQAFRSVPEAWSTADDRVTVLEHQLEYIRSRLAS